jgi:hypothetical protein
MDESARVASMAFPIATMPSRLRDDTSKAFSDAPGPLPRNSGQDSRIVVHCPLAISKFARYDEKGRRQFAFFKLLVVHLSDNGSEQALAIT